MGVDVVLYGVGQISDERLTEANAYLKSRVDPGFIWDDDGEGALVRSTGSSWLACGDARPDLIEFRTLYRYYGPGYERGSWPDIFAAIVAFKYACPELTVYYESDSGDFYECSTPATDEYLDELWKHYLGPDGVAYYVSRRAHDISHPSSS